MTGYFSQLIQTKSSYFSIAILAMFLSNGLFLQNIFAESVNSLEDIERLDIILVDDDQAKDFIDQLSSYDHVEVEELSDSQARELLEQANSQSLAYSSYEFGHYARDMVNGCKIFGLITFAVGGILFAVQFSNGEIKRSDMITGTLFSGVGGCVVGYAVVSLFLALPQVADNFLRGLSDKSDQDQED